MGMFLILAGLVACGDNTTTEGITEKIEAGANKAVEAAGDAAEATADAANAAANKTGEAIEATGDAVKAAGEAVEGAVIKKKVFFLMPQDGATLKSPVKASFGIQGFQVQAAGDVNDHTGHHHIIIDGEPVAKGQPVPKNDTHIHFGDGQTSTELDLAPGKHTLTLQFADGAHNSYGPEMSQTITVEITE